MQHLMCYMPYHMHLNLLGRQQIYQGFKILNFVYGYAKYLKTYRDIFTKSRVESSFSADSYQDSI